MELELTTERLRVLTSRMIDEHDLTGVSVISNVKSKWTSIVDLEVTNILCLTISKKKKKHC